MSEQLLDRAGRRRSPATLPGFHAGHAPGNKGLRYPADPPKVEEIIAVMRGRDRHARPPAARVDRDHVASRAAHPGGAGADGSGSRSTPWLAAGPAWQGRAPSRGRHGRVGLGTASALARLAARASGPLLCVINGTTRGRHWSAAAARAELRRTAAAAGVRRRFAPHQLRHAHAVEMAREGVPLIVIQRQLGHSNLGITSVYLQGIDSGEIIETVHARRAPMIPVSASLRL
jgi:hypothetical protein